MLCLLLLFPAIWDKPTPPPDAIKLPAPGVQYRANVASATSVPWIDSNVWQIERKPDATYFYDVPNAALAMAEAYAYQAHAQVHTADPAGMLDFLHKIDKPAFPALVNLGVIDDGSDAAGEVLNLLARRNLLFRIVAKPDPKLDLNLNPMKEGATDPFAYAQKVRQRLGDDKRLVRLYGTDVVIARLTGEAGKARLHLLNYSNRKVVGMRVRLKGRYAKGEVAAYQVDHPELADYTSAEGATEFTLSELGAYAVIDLN